MKKALIVLGLVALAGGAYYLWKKSQTPKRTKGAGDPNAFPGAPPVGRLLKSVQGIFSPGTRRTTRTGQDTTGEDPLMLAGEAGAGAGALFKGIGSLFSSATPAQSPSRVGDANALQAQKEHEDAVRMAAEFGNPEAQKALGLPSADQGGVDGSPDGYQPGTDNSSETGYDYGTPDGTPAQGVVEANADAQATNDALAAELPQDPSFVGVDAATNMDAAPVAEPTPDELSIV
jgi:hypothetical protein